ncbi:MAG TPA: alpha/beta fold hydrolase [Baekduia sp.]
MSSTELRHAIELEDEVRRAIEATDDVAVARQHVRAVVLERNAKRVPDDIEVEVVDAGGVGAEWVVSPLDPERRVVVFVHGGGFTLGSAAESRELTARLARASQARVLALDIRLAPEARFPAPIDDVLAAFRWLVADGADPREIALVGESTGAAAVLAAAVALRDAGEAGPGAVALLSPVLDLRAPDQDLARGAELYRGDAPADDPRVSPVLADLDGLPPLFVQAGTADTAAAAAAELARRAEEAGVVVVHQEWEGMIHRWQTHPHVYDATRAVHQVGDFLLRRIGPGYVPVQPAA